MVIFKFLGKLHPQLSDATFSVYLIPRTDSITLEEENLEICALPVIRKGISGNLRVFAHRELVCPLFSGIAPNTLRRRTSKGRIVISRAASRIPPTSLELPRALCSRVDDDRSFAYQYQTPAKTQDIKATPLSATPPVRFPHSQSAGNARPPPLYLHPSSRKIQGDFSRSPARARLRRGLSPSPRSRRARNDNQIAPGT